MNKETATHILFVFFSILPFYAFGQSIKCTNDSSRTVQLNYLDKKGQAPCEVVLSLDEKHTSLWRAQYDVSYCVGQFETYLSTLNSRGLDCSVTPMEEENASHLATAESKPDLMIIGSRRKTSDRVNRESLGKKIVVHEHDTISAILVRNYVAPTESNVQFFIESNRLVNDEIVPGSTLIIPQNIHKEKEDEWRANPKTSAQSLDLPVHQKPDSNSELKFESEIVDRSFGANDSKNGTKAKLDPFADAFVNWSSYGQLDLKAFIFSVSGISKNTLLDVREYDWDFGDGTTKTSTSRELIHAYKRPGDYNVKLKLERSDGRIVLLNSKKIKVEEFPVPNIRDVTPPLINTISETVHIDGDINEEVWQTAAIIPHLIQYPDDHPEKEHTEVRVLVDSDTLYVSFRNHTKDTATINAGQTIRDHSMGEDERVVVELETFNTSSLVSRFSVNAIGTQSDSIMGGRASNIGWKGDWIAAAKETDYGWSAEMAIPFGILNFNRSATEFGANFKRFRSKSKKWSSWVGRVDNKNLSREGTLKGFKLNSVSKQKKLSALSYFLVGANGVDINEEPEKEFSRAGVTLRYEPQSDITIVGDLFPDFTQLERSFGSIDFSYTERSLGEVRPFFQEGQAFFDTNNNLFYSRRIPNLYAGIKSFARIENISIGGFLTLSPDQRVDSFIRYNNDYQTNHSVELVSVSTNRKQLTNFAVGSSMSGKTTAGYNYDLNFGHSDTKSDREINGSFGLLKVDHSLGNFDYGIDVSQYHRNFQPSNGRVDNNLLGTRGGAINLGYSVDGIKSLVTYFQTNLTLDYRDTLQEQLQKKSIYWDAMAMLGDNLTLTAANFDSIYRPNSGEAGEFSESVNHDHYSSLNLDYYTDTNRYGYGIYYADGKLGGGDYQYISSYVWAKPTRSTFFQLSTADLDSFGRTTQYTLDGTLKITNHSSLSGQYYKEDDFDYTRVQYSRVVRSGIDVFSVFQKNANTDPEFSFKLVWSF